MLLAKKVRGLLVTVGTTQETLCGERIVMTVLKIVMLSQMLAEQTVLQPVVEMEL